MSPTHGGQAVIGATWRARSVRAAAAGALAMVFALATLLLLTPTADAQLERWVAPGGACGGRSPCHGSIQAAVDAAESGEAIRILPGAYTETVTAVDKAVVLTGPGGAAEAFDPGRHVAWAAPGGAALTIDARTRDVAGVAISGLRFRSAVVAIRLIGRRAGDPDGAPPGRPPSTTDTAVRGARIADNAFMSVGVGAGQPAPPLGPSPAAIEARYAEGLTTERNVVQDGEAGFVLIGASGVLRDDRFEGIDQPAVRAAVGSGNLAMDGCVVLAAGERAVDLAPLPSASGSAGAVLIDGAHLEGGAGIGIHAEGLRGALVISGVVATGMAGAGIQLVDVGDARIRASRLVANGEGVRLVETRPAAAGSPGIVIGGSPALANDLGANAGLAVVRERAPGIGSGADIDAKYNAWGVAWPDAIEALIQDALDRPDLGRVRWRPPLGVPEAVTVTVSPALLPAGGAVPAMVTARVIDAARMPAVDALLVLAAGPGALGIASAAVEAEDPPVLSLGEWGLFKGGRFGAFRGTGYLQTDVVGAALGWTFPGQALAVRLAHSPDRPGVLSAAVDRGLPMLIDTRDDAERWAEHLVARGLDGGSHHVTLTLVSGQLAIDALAAGLLTDGDGVVRTELSPPADVGRGVVRAEAWGASGVRVGEAVVEFVPGPPATVALTATDATIPVGTGSTAVTATVRDALGRPVRDGTPVRFATTLGTVAPTATTTARGLAHAMLAAGTVAGTARVSATVGADDAPLAGWADVVIAPGLPAQLVVRTTPAQMTANSRDASRIDVVVNDAFDNPVADATRVELAVSLGTFEVDGAPATHARTRAGRVEGVLRAGAVAGTAHVRASVGPLTEAATVTLSASDLRVRKVVEPESALVPGEWVTYTVTYRNDGPGSVYDVLIDDPMPIQLADMTLNIDGPPLIHHPRSTYRFVAPRIGAGQEGTIQVRARVDPSLAWGARTAITNTVRMASATAAERVPEDNEASATILVIPVAVYSVTLSAPPSLPVGGATGEVVIRVFDRDGRYAADDTPVDLSVDRGTIAPARVTLQGGQARATYTTGRSAGQATIRALAPDGRGTFARVAVLPGPVAEVDVAADREWLPVGGLTATITAALRDQYGNPVADAPVMLATTLGALLRVEGATNAEGQITSTLLSGVRAGVARVTARSGTLSRAISIPFRPGDPARLSLEVGTGKGYVGVPHPVRARVADAYDNPIAGQRVVFKTTIGWLRVDEVVTGADGTATTVIECSVAGNGLVEARLDDLRASAGLTMGTPRAFIPFALGQRAR